MKCHKLCPHKKFEVCILAITNSNLHQIQKTRSLSKSAFYLLSLLLIFGQAKDEIIEVKDTRGHSQVFRFLQRG